MTNYRLIREAIENKLIVHANYDGYSRAFCPHVLGDSDGIHRCLGYQFGGQSSKGDLPEWRCFEVQRLNGIKLIPGQWRTAPAQVRLLPRRIITRRSPNCIEVVHAKVRLR